MRENTFALVKNWLHACSSHRATFVAVFSCKVRVDDGSIEIESRDRGIFPGRKPAPWTKLSIFPCFAVLSPQNLLLFVARSSAKTSPRRRPTSGAERTTSWLQPTRKKKKSETKEGEKKERKEEGGVLPLGPMMTKTTSKVFLMDSLRCLCSLCRASNRYQNFLV